MHWFQFWLILHILGVIIAFGPAFSFPLIASLGRKNPQHGLFAAELMETVEKRLTLPLSILVPLFGTALIYTAHVDLWKSEWLIIAIVLYMGAFFFSLFVQTPNTRRMIEALRAMPAPAPGGAPPAGGPPPQVAALGKKLQFGGMYMGLSVVAVLVLMIWRPGASFT